LGIPLSLESERDLLDQYQRLEAYPDAVPGLQRLTRAGYRPVAFSNGVESSVRKLLQHASNLPHLNG
jgi:FMN phosphatase YigB (HAD superfamily)